jgi:hypothetical protein
MSTMTLALMLSLGLSAQNGDVAAPKPVELVGKVKEVGGGPAGRAQAVLSLDDGTEWVLYSADPEAQGELVRLSGVRAHIRGTLGDPRLPGNNAVMVQRYQIVDIGKGVVPRIGHLASLQLDGKTRLLFVDEEGTAELLPDGYAEKLMKQVGAKLWMVGNKSGERFQPMRFAILRSGGLKKGAEQ